MKSQPIFEIQDGGVRHLEFRYECNFNETDAFNVKFSFYHSNLVRIGPIVKKWQPIFEIQDGSSRHLEFRCICIFNVTVVFYVTFSTFPSDLNILFIVYCNNQVHYK